MAAKALGVSPFSKEFESLSEAQITWAILQHYKDQEEDLEKYKLICRFTNPEAAKKIFDVGSESETEEISEEFLNEIKTHTKSDIDNSTLRKFLANPEDHLPESDKNTLDRIEKVE